MQLRRLLYSTRVQLNGGFAGRNISEKSRKSYVDFIRGLSYFIYTRRDPHKRVVFELIVIKIYEVRQ